MGTGGGQCTHVFEFRRQPRGGIGPRLTTVRDVSNGHTTPPQHHDNALNHTHNHGQSQGQQHKVTLSRGTEFGASKWKKHGSLRQPSDGQPTTYRHQGMQLRSRRWALVSDLPKLCAQSHVHASTVSCDDAPPLELAKWPDVVSRATTSCACLVTVSTFSSACLCHVVVAQSHASLRGCVTRANTFRAPALSRNVRAESRYSQQGDVARGSQLWSR